MERALINFRDEANVGGKNIRASRNVQFNMIQPQFDIITLVDHLVLLEQLELLVEQVQVVQNHHS